MAWAHEITYNTTLDLISATTSPSTDFYSWYEVTKFIYSMMLGVLLWDIVMALGEEFQMFRKHPLRLTNIIYITARVFALASIVSTVVYTFITSLDCNSAIQAATWITSFAIPSNALLFLIRANTVYHDSRLARSVFTLLWLATFASLVGPWAVESSKIGSGPASFCAITTAAKYTGTVWAISALFDTVVFIAISIRVLSLSLASTWRSRFKAFIRGQGLGRLTRALLKTGQLYYLVTVWFTFASTIVIFGPYIPVIFAVIPPMFNLILQNIMACKVFRLLKLGHIHDPQTLEITPIAFGSLPESSATDSVGTITGKSKADAPPQGNEIIV